MNAIIDAHHDRSWGNGHGYFMRATGGGIVVTMPATPVRHGISFTLTRGQVVDFANVCLKAAADDCDVELGPVEGR